MVDIRDADDLTEHLREAIEFAAAHAWEYAQQIGWDKAYPLFSQDLVEPLTKHSLISTYTQLIRRMYERLQQYMGEDLPLNPEEAVILTEYYADFLGAVVLTPSKPPLFKLGILY